MLLSCPLLSVLPPALSQGRRCRADAPLPAARGQIARTKVHTFFFSRPCSAFFACRRLAARASPGAGVCLWRKISPLCPEEGIRMFRSVWFCIAAERGKRRKGNFLRFSRPVSGMHFYERLTLPTALVYTERGFVETETGPVATGMGSVAPTCTSRSSYMYTF